MDKKKLAEKTAEAGNWLANATIDAIAEAKMRHEDDLYYDGYEAGRESQRDLYVKAAIRAFFELKAKDQEIFRLLSEYFNVDSISEATALLRDAKKTRQIIALRQYCNKNGMTNREFRDYAREYQLEDRLLEDERLLDIQPEKPKSIIDKTK